ncbi:MAG: hypothetical protein B6U95_05470 [Thermofilum sp. ex4484_82]|nr:hypothetical protein [Thermoproteales archaeon]OYT27897.1 MAG: hypothetical protein B6U95_05470 [Thermofilum sp. ex4484_82]OYT37963.1 MAG: hypothetical protein B6U96_05465 [Archaeoglobales archaeon ex4484_92]RLE76764.1 MAG: hypothetical protein DRZ80_00445 [Thermoprotei archaeon]RLE83673.1 MAG: hypothetical protein DRJ39_04475 [Thermoprotei archaeon]
MPRKHSSSDVLYRSYDEIKALVVITIISLIRKTKGSAITFTAKKIAVSAGLPAQPVILTLVKDILENLSREKLIKVYSKTSHGVKYMITKSSALWLIAKGKGKKTLKSPYLETIIPIITKNVS